MNLEETKIYEEKMKNQLETNGWYGVDLDGTLAYYTGWKGPEEIGEPIPLMLARVKKWLADGIEVRIVTARASYPNPIGLAAIAVWCQKHVGKILPVTCSKDLAMICLYDDRAIQVEMNTGKILGQE